MGEVMRPVGGGSTTCLAAVMLLWWHCASGWMALVLPCLCCLWVRGTCLPSCHERL